MQAAQRPQVPPVERVGAGGAVLEPADVQQALSKVHLVPAQRGQFTDPQPVAVSDEDHGSVAVALPPEALGGCDQLLDLCRGEKLPAPALGIGALPGRVTRTFPKTRIGGGEGDLVNCTVLRAFGGRTFPKKVLFGNGHGPGEDDW